MGPKRRISLEHKGKVLALSEEGYSQQVIAVRVGCRKLTGSVKDQDSRSEEKDRGEKTEPWSEKVCLIIKLLQR